MTSVKRAQKFHTDVSPAKSMVRCKKPFDKTCTVNGRAYEVRVIVSSQISTHPHFLFANGEIYFMLLLLKIFLNKTLKNCSLTYVIQRQKEEKNVMYLRLYREMSTIIITVDQFGKAYCIYNSSHYFKQKESPFEMIIALKNLMLNSAVNCMSYNTI